MNDAVEDKIKTDLINTGIFLESDTYQLFKNWKLGGSFSVLREHPFTYGLHPNLVHGRIDVLCTAPVGNMGSIENILIMPIECKKANPKLKHWVFEPFRPIRDKEKQYLVSIVNGNLTYSNSYQLSELQYNSYKDYENCIQVFEFSMIDGRQNTQTEKSMRAYYAIQQANQAATGLINATNSIVPSHLSHYKRFIIPVVVTTANLWINDYDPQDIDKRTGEISKDSIHLQKKDWVLYSYPLDSLQDTEGESVSGKMSPLTRPTFIVNSEYLEKFTTAIMNDVGYIGDL